MISFINFLLEQKDQEKVVLDYLINGREEDGYLMILGITNNYEEAGYILKDGNMLDLSGKNMGGFGGDRVENHNVISYAFDHLNPKYQSDYVYQLMNWGHIRCGGNFIQIIKRPTIKQYHTLRNYIKYFIRKNEFVVEIVNPKGHTIKSLEYERNENVDYIINEIQEHFA